MAEIKNIELIREQVKIWLEEYRTGAIKHEKHKFIKDLENLIVAIRFAINPESIKMIKQFYKLRNEIQVHHVNKQKFNTRYNKLNKKVMNTLTKMISEIWNIDYMLGEHAFRLYCFNSDVTYYTNELNNGIFPYEYIE